MASLRTGGEPDASAAHGAPSLGGADGLGGGAEAFQDDDDGLLEPEHFHDVELPAEAGAAGERAFFVRHGAVQEDDAVAEEAEEAAAERRQAEWEAAEAAEEAKAAPAWQALDSAFINAKAGMDGVDKEAVQKKVYELSKGSKHYQEQERKNKEAERRIRAMLAKRDRLLKSPALLDAARATCDAKVAELEATRDLSRTFLVIDMDAFFASVEELERPELKRLPMAVGGISMISTANYVARLKGVRSAMPGFIARELEPNLVFVRPNFRKYTHYAKLVREVLREYDPRFISNSLDEAYLDITDVCKRRSMPPGEIAAELRHAVFKKTGLTCSAGVAPNRRLAKVGSDVNKPNGQHVLPPNRKDILEFTSALPCRKVNGIGAVMDKILHALGIHTLGDVYENRALLHELFSKNYSTFFLNVSLGLGSTAPVAERKPGEVGRKGMSHERTFEAISLRKQQFSKVAEIAHYLESDLRKAGLKFRTLTLKVKSAKFVVHTRQKTFPKFVDSAADFLPVARELLTEYLNERENGHSVRLLGLRASYFFEPAQVPVDQRSLDGFLVERGAVGVPEPAGASGAPPPGPSGVDDDVTFVCDRCAKRIQLADRDEHNDWHFASDLAAEDRSAPRPAQRGPKRSQQPTIFDALKKKRNS